MSDHGHELLDCWALQAPEIPGWFMPLPEKPPMPKTLCASCKEQSNSLSLVVQLTNPLDCRERCPHEDEDCNRARALTAEFIADYVAKCNVRVKERQIMWPYHWASLQLGERAQTMHNVGLSK